MPMLRTVEAWPSTRHPDRAWHSDADLAAFLGASRGVFDLYSDELPAAEQTAKASSIRFFIADNKRERGFEVGIRGRFYDGFDMANIRVPQGFGTLSRDDRVRACLEVIHAGVTAFADLRGWDRARLDEVRQRVLQRGLRFTWASDWKAGPGRHHQARAVFWLDDDGHGRMQLEIRRYDDGTAIARSQTAPAFMTAEGFKRSATTLHWHGADLVSVVPWSGLLGDAGLLQLTVADARTPAATPAPLAAGGPSPAVTSAVISEDDWGLDPNAFDWLLLQVQDTAGTGAYDSEVRRVTTLLAKEADFAAWWAAVPYRRLLLRVTVPHSRRSEFAPKPGARKSGKDLVLQIVTVRSDLARKAAADKRERAWADVHGALVALATSRRFPPPPPMPAQSE